MNKIKSIIGIGIIMNSLLLSGQEHFSFLFLGDLHYHSPAWKTARTVKEISDDINKKSLKIDFVCHVGDLIENQENGNPISLEDGAKEWEFAINDIKKNFKIPFFMSLGNHDWYGNNNWFGGRPNVEKYYLPFMAKELGSPLNGKPFFSFRWADSYFLFTNHMGFDIGLDKEQRTWMEKSLAYAEGNPGIKHVFIFGHPNLWNLGYFRFNENAELLNIINKFKKVDAYFCGHTHHNNASVWNFDKDRKLLQINGCPLGCKEAELLSPIGERQLILNPPPSKRGYAKGFEKVHGYFVVSVNDANVTVALELIGGGRIWEFSWGKPGEIKEKFFHSKMAKTSLPSAKLKEIKEAFLHIYPYVPEKVLLAPKPIEIMFNGEKIGILPRLSHGS